MKYKAKKEYAELPNDKNFLALGSASTHLKLIAGLTVELNKNIKISKEIKECLIEVKNTKGDK